MDGQRSPEQPRSEQQKTPHIVDAKFTVSDRTQEPQVKEDLTRRADLLGNIRRKLSGLTGASEGKSARVEPESSPERSYPELTGPQTALAGRELVDHEVN